MKYTSLINNVKTLEWELTLSQAFLMDLISMAAMWAERETINGLDYYWVSRNKVLDELPHVFKEADTVYRALKGLHQKGVIDYQKVGKKDVVRFTEKGKEWSFKQSAVCNELGNKSELDQKLGNKSEQTRKKIRENSDLNPTDNITNNNITKDEEAAAAANGFLVSEQQAQAQAQAELSTVISEAEAFQVLKAAGIFPMFVNQPNSSHFKPEIFKFNSWFEGSKFKTNQLRAKLTAWFQNIAAEDRVKFYTDDTQLQQQTAHPSHKVAATDNTPKLSAEEQRQALERARARFMGAK